MARKIDEIPEVRNSECESPEKRAAQTRVLLRNGYNMMGEPTGPEPTKQPFSGDRKNMFRTNKPQQQPALFSNVNDLPEKRRQRLEQSWAGTFRRECKCDPAP